MNTATVFIFVAALICAVVATKGGSRGKRSPQLPPLPPLPEVPGVPPLPLPFDFDSLGRFRREASDSGRVARQAPPLPTLPQMPKRVVRAASEESSFDQPKHIRQESLFSSVTTVERKKRGTA